MAGTEPGCGQECSEPGLRRDPAAGPAARCRHVLRRRSSRAVSVSGPGLGHEERLAVVLQLLDALLDVGERAVAAALLGGGEVDPRVPAAGQLLDRRDVDDPVVQVVLELGHVPGEEAAVGRDRVAGERRPPRVGHAGADVVEHGLLGLGERSCRRRARRAGRRTCASARTTSPICSSAVAGGLMTTSTPSPSTFSSESVTSTATSTSASGTRSSPVISQSIQTIRSWERSCARSALPPATAVTVRAGAGAHPAATSAAGANLPRVRNVPSVRDGSGYRPVVPPGLPAGQGPAAPARRALRPALVWAAVVLVTGGCALLTIAEISRVTGVLGVVTGAALAAVPVLGVVAAFLWLDRYEAEPPSLLAFAFAWGAGVASFGALVINTASLQAIHEAGGDPTRAVLVVAPVVEEALKASAVLLVLLRAPAGVRRGRRRHRLRRDRGRRLRLRRERPLPRPGVLGGRRQRARDRVRRPVRGLAVRAPPVHGRDRRRRWASRRAPGGRWRGWWRRWPGSRSRSGCTPRGTSRRSRGCRGSSACTSPSRCRSSPRSSRSRCWRAGGRGA